MLSKAFDHLGNGYGMDLSCPSHVFLQHMIFDTTSVQPNSKEVRMHERFFKMAGWKPMLHEGPLCDHARRFMEHIAEQGATERAQERRARNLACFIDWLYQHGVTEPHRMTCEHVLQFQELMAARRLERGHHFFTGGVMSTMPTVKLFLQWLYRQGVRFPPMEAFANYDRRGPCHPALGRVPRKGDVPNGVVQTPRISFAPEQFRSIEAEWQVYLRDIRGATPSTVENYSRAAARFFSFLLEKGIGDIARVGPEEMRAFHDATLSLTPNQRSMIYNSLRCLFRFAALKGWANADLIELVGRSPRYKLARLPDFLSDEEVRKVLETPDATTPEGVRSLAMLSLLATYGMRGGDLAALTLDDFDWEHDLIRVRQNKVNRTVWLPLLPGAGNAVLKYIREARPATQGREVFLRRYPPHTAIGEGSVYAVVIRTCQKAGVKKRRLGPHLFRHTMATRLVRNSEPLKTVGDILGHNCSASTAIYAKVAVEQLREVALSFKEARP